MSTLPSDAPVRRPRWPWVVLGLGLLWTVLIRVPLIVNAPDHLDSDLAVDGLTLLRCRTGTLAVALSRHAATWAFCPCWSLTRRLLIWGARPDHAREWRHDHLVTGDRLDVLAGGQGVWARCGRLGDLAAGILIAGDDLVVGTDHRRPPADPGMAHGGVRGPLCLPHSRSAGRRRRRSGSGAAWGSISTRCSCSLWRAWCRRRFSRGFRQGGRKPASVWRPCLRSPCWPVSFRGRLAGAVDPYDAYPSQFAATLETGAIGEHARLLFLNCLPRLLAGTEFNLER